jgi:DNA-binding GntR family transcriptional regulator
MSTALPPIPTKADQVFEVLQERILDGTYEPGRRLSMDALAKELGVSKIPVREAIGRLESQRLVVSKQHAGPTVSLVNVRELRGVYLARQELEPLIARLAAENIDADGLEVLTSIHRDMRDALRAEEFGRLGELNARFHGQVADATGFAIFVEFSSAMLLAVRRHRVIEPLETDNWAHVLEEHNIILAALTAHDPEAAADAARFHVASQSAHDTRQG